MLWSCRFSVEVWKKTEKQINDRFRTNIEIKYHNVIMGFNPEKCKNHAAINTGKLANLLKTLKNCEGHSTNLLVRNTTLFYKKCISRQILCSIFNLNFHFKEMKKNGK